MTELLPRTLESLKVAGFSQPRLFVDGAEAKDNRWDRFQLETTLRHPKLRSYGNWILALGELYIRTSTASRFAIFQDDFITVKNLRTYLESIKLLPQTYWNLYTFPHNQPHAYISQSPARDRCDTCRGKKDCELHKVESNHKGFYQSNQRGQGAVALVFSRETTQALLSSQKMITHPTNASRGWRNIDGEVAESLVGKLGYRELVHSPSLTQHIGTISSMQSGYQKTAISFPSENFDALDFLKKA